MRPGHPPSIPAKMLQVGWRGVAVRSLGDPDRHREPSVLLRVWPPRHLRVQGSAWVAAPGRPPGAKGICMSDSGWEGNGWGPSGDPAAGARKVRKADPRGRVQESRPAEGGFMGTWGKALAGTMRQHGI